MLQTIRNWWGGLVPARPRPRARRLSRGLMHYWINPEGETARAAWMRAQFERTGLRNARVRACTPSTLPPLELPPRHSASPLQLACLCSHFAALERGLAEGDELFMVMEDDILLPFEVDFERLLEQAPADWEILQLYVVNAERLQAMFTRSYRRGRLWERWKPLNHSTGAYVCSRDAAQRLLSKFKPGGVLDLRGYRGRLLADDLLYRAAPTYSATYPLYIENDAFESTLDSLKRFHAKSHAAVRRIWDESAGPDFAAPIRAREPG